MRCTGAIRIIGSGWRFACRSWHRHKLIPSKRDLIQFGYNQPLEGKAPLAAYAYHYHNDPNFLHTNVTLRIAALAPVYLDSELGFVHGLGPQIRFCDRA